MKIKPVYDRILGDGYFKTIKLVQEVPELKSICEDDLPVCFLLQPKDNGSALSSDSRGRQPISSIYQFYVVTKTTNDDLSGEPLITEVRTNLIKLLSGFSVSSEYSRMQFNEGSIDIYNPRITAWICQFSTNLTLLPD